MVMVTPRTILFKAKRLDNGEWVEGYYIHVRKHSHEIISYICNENNEIPNVYPSYPIYRIDPTTLSQFTGLKDKHGNKIWEHDIVTIKADDEYFHLHWEEDTARFIMENYDDRFSVDFDNYWSYEVEVYGNIFDNKDLIYQEETEEQ